MIRVTRLNREEIALNCDLIQSIEARPDTTIRLVTGEKFLVLEAVAEVLDRVQAWRAGVLQRAGLATELARGADVIVHLPQLREPSLLEALGLEEAPNAGAQAVEIVA